MSRILAFLSGLAITVAAQHPQRTWTSRQGTKIEAAFVEFVGNRARLESADGRSLEVPVLSFGAADQAWLKQIAAARKLREGVRSPDRAQAQTALRTMQSQGEPGGIELGLAFRAWYEESFEPLVEKPLHLKTRQPEAEACRAFFERQEKALALARKLKKEGVYEMRQVYEGLDALYHKVLATMQDFEDLAASRDELARYTGRVREYAPAEYDRVWENLVGLERQMAELRESEKPEGGRAPTGRAPFSPGPRFQWFYDRAREIETGIREGRHGMDGGELDNVRAVNHYRELLGLEPYRVAEKLMRTARGHSRDMVEHKFFAHESPLPGKRTVADRARREGYASGAGENILYGTGDGVKAFWQWFDSPGHHANLIGDYAEIGVGRFNTHWTQVFGRGK